MEDSIAGETGSLSFDLTGLQIDSKQQESGLALSDLPTPRSERFEFILSGSKNGEPWIRKETFPANQKIASIGRLPVGAVKVELRTLDSRGVLLKSAAGEAQILRNQVTTLELTLQSSEQTNDSGTLIIKIIDKGAAANLCDLGPIAPPLCALMAFQPNQICDVTISATAYRGSFGWCGPKVEFQNHLCSKGVAVTQNDVNNMRCTAAAGPIRPITPPDNKEKVCTAVAGNLYSRRNASAIPFKDGCQKSQLLESGAAVRLADIPALFGKGEACAAVISHWAHRQTKEKVQAADGCEAAGLKSLGFTELPHQLQGK